MSDVGPYGMTAHESAHAYRADRWFGRAVVATVACCVGWFGGATLGPHRSPSLSEAKAERLATLAGRIYAMGGAEHEYEVAGETARAYATLSRCARSLESYESQTERFTVGQMADAGLPLPDPTWCRS